MVHDPSRNLIYVASDAAAPVHPSTIVTVDAATAAVASFVPVGNDPQPLALSDDGSALWVGLVGERRVRRMTPGTTPVPGPAYSLPMLLTTGEASVPKSLAVLPGTPSSIAVGVQGAQLRRPRRVHPRRRPAARELHPAARGRRRASSPTARPGTCSAWATPSNLVVFRLGTLGATLESHGGLVSSSYQTGLRLQRGLRLREPRARSIDLTNPDAPLPAGRFAFTDCALAIRSATRVMMLCPNAIGRGPILRMLDSATFTVGSVTLPDSLSGQSWAEFAYIGGDAVALLGYDVPLQIMRAPIIGSPP